jgi:beta-phosphoglucomutase-like phosphatase (HAD superfamily)
MLGVVVEDAPAGIRSGLAAGCRVLAVCTSHSRSSLENLGATWIVSDLSWQVPRSRYCENALTK